MGTSLSGTGLLRELVAAVDRGESVARVVIVDAHRSVPRRAGASMLVWADGRTVGTVGGGEMEARAVRSAGEALADGRPRRLRYELLDPGAGDPGVCGGEVELYVEPHVGDPTIYVIGCGHVGRAVVDLAHWLGFRVVATDDRTELVTAAHLPHADVRIAGPIDEVLALALVTSNTDVVLVTRNVAVDLDILPALVATEARSIGVMGSRRRWATTRTALGERGLTDQQIARIHSPIGLEIAAETPEEIAVSIMAEIVESRRRGSVTDDAVC
jgi:xanthine dehydrogenase accessory factor